MKSKIFPVSAEAPRAMMALERSVTVAGLTYLKGRGAGRGGVSERDEGGPRGEGETGRAEISGLRGIVRDGGARIDTNDANEAVIAANAGLNGPLGAEFSHMVEIGV